MAWNAPVFAKEYGLHRTMADTRTVRQSIQESLWALGAARESRWAESLLMREGNYCGHRFNCDGFEAVWFVEENQVKFYSPLGGLIEALDVTQVISRRPREEQRRAA